MSVKVLRRGSSIFPIQITCQKCRALLSIGKPLDLSVIKHDEEFKECFVLCPDCLWMVILYKADTAQALYEYYLNGGTEGR